MGVGSLVAPIVAEKLLSPVTPGRGRLAKSLVAVAAGGAVVATLGDLVARPSKASDPDGTDLEIRRRRARRSRPGRATRQPRRAKAEGPNGGGISRCGRGLSAGISAATSWASFTTAERLWSKRRGRDVETVRWHWQRRYSSGTSSTTGTIGSCTRAGTCGQCT